MIDNREVHYIVEHQRVGANRLNLTVNADGYAEMFPWTNDGKKFSIQIGTGPDCILGEFQILQILSSSLLLYTVVLGGRFVTLDSLQ